MKTVARKRLTPGEKQIVASGYPLDAFSAAKRFLADRGITARYEWRRDEWILGCIGRKDGPTYVRLRIGTGALIDYLDAPSRLIEAFRDKGANVARR